MRVCIDGTFWGPNSPPSAVHVTHDLVRTWSETHPEDQISVVVPPGDAQLARDELRAAPRVDVIEAPKFFSFIPQAFSAFFMGWISTGRLRRRGDPGFDAVITHNFSSLSARQLRVCLVHDILFVEHPEWFTRAELLYLRMIRPFLRRADVVLATSASECERIGRMWPETLTRLCPVGLAPSSEILDAVATPPVSIPNGEFVLAVGRLNTRKNLARLIAAFGTVRATGPELSLVVVGGRDGSFDDLGEHPGVHFTGRISDSELVWFYRNCRAFAFPSLAEGFGLPLLEADAFEVPVVCSDLPVFRELGVADEYFDPEDVQSISAALERVLNSVRSHEVRRRTEHDWPAVVRATRNAIVERIER